MKLNNKTQAKKQKIKICPHYDDPASACEDSGLVYFLVGRNHRKKKKQKSVCCFGGDPTGNSDVIRVLRSWLGKIFLQAWHLRECPACYWSICWGCYIGAYTMPLAHRLEMDWLKKLVEGYVRESKVLVPYLHCLRLRSGSWGCPLIVMPWIKSLSDIVFLIPFPWLDEMTDMLLLVLRWFLRLICVGIQSNVNSN